MLLGATIDVLSVQTGHTEGRPSLVVTGRQDNGFLRGSIAVEGDEDVAIISVLLPHGQEGMLETFEAMLASLVRRRLPDDDRIEGDPIRLHETAGFGLFDRFPASLVIWDHPAPGPGADRFSETHFDVSILPRSGRERLNPVRYGKLMREGVQLRWPDAQVGRISPIRTGLGSGLEREWRTARADGALLVGFVWLFRLEALEIYIAAQHPYGSPEDRDRLIRVRDGIALR